MENFNRQNGPGIKERRLQQLAENLAKARESGKSDVILVCDGKEFPAHKNVLQSSCQYFESMFRSGMEEAQSGRVEFVDMEPETLGIILDFLYLGDVSKLNSEEKVKKVLAATHLMHLEDLFQYCCDALMTIVPEDAFAKIWDTAALYNKERMLVPLMEYLFINRSEILAKDAFLSLSLDQIREFVEFAKSRLLCMDEILVGLVQWIQKDKPARQKHVKELFECIGVEPDMQEGIKSFLAEASKSSEELSYGLNALMSSSRLVYYASERTQVSPVDIGCGKAKIVFFCEYQQEEIEPSSESFRSSWPTYIQQFDVQTLTWLPGQAFAADLKGVGLTLHGSTIHVAGGALKTVIVLYNVVTNSVGYSHDQFGFYRDRMDAGYCIFKTRVYGIGGCFREVQTSSVYCTGLATFDLKYSRTAPTVLASSDHIFVIDGSYPENGLVIEFTSDIDSDGKLTRPWNAIQIPNVAETLIKHFFLANDTLHGFYCGNGRFTKLLFNKTTKKVETKNFPFDAPDLQKVRAVYQFPDPNSTLIFVSTLKTGPPVPNFLWEPELNKWTKLIPPKGKCELLEADVIKKSIYLTGI